MYYRIVPNEMHNHLNDRSQHMLQRDEIKKLAIEVVLIDIPNERKNHYRYFESHDRLVDHSDRMRQVVVVVETDLVCMKLVKCIDDVRNRCTMRIRAKFVDVENSMEINDSNVLLIVH